MIRKAYLVRAAIIAALCCGPLTGVVVGQFGSATKTFPASGDSKRQGVWTFYWGGLGSFGDTPVAHFRIGLTVDAGDLTGPGTGRAPVESALQQELVFDTIDAFLAAHPEVVASAAKESLVDSVDTVQLNPKKWPSPKSGEVLLKIPKIHQWSAEPHDRELPEGSRFLTFQAEMSKASWPIVNGPEHQFLQTLKFSRQLAQKLAQDLPDFSREYLKKRMVDGVAMFESKIKLAQANRDALQKTLTESAGLPREKSAEQLAEVSRQLIGARLALVGMEARESAIADQIKKTEAKMAGATESDETLRGLEKLFALRSEQLNRLKQLRSKNAVAEQEVQTREAGVLSAKIELDKAKAALKRASGGERLETFNDELSRLAIDRAEAKARFAYLEEASKNLADELRNREAAEHRIEEAKPKLDEATKQIRKLSEQLATVKAAQEKIEPIRVILPPEEAEAASETKK